MHSQVPLSFRISTPTWGTASPFTETGASLTGAKGSATFTWLLRVAGLRLVMETPFCAGDAGSLDLVFWGSDSIGEDEQQSSGSSRKRLSYIVFITQYEGFSLQLRLCKVNSRSSVSGKSQNRWNRQGSAIKTDTIEEFCPCDACLPFLLNSPDRENVHF